MSFDKEIDVTGKSCPYPLIMLARETPGMAKGQTIRITGSDPLFEPSVAEFCREWNHEIVESTREGRNISIVIRILTGCGVNC